jgi:anti-anti-sigma regulatory factor
LNAQGNNMAARTVTVIPLDEECGIKRIGILHRAAISAAEAGSDCVIDCARATRIDCSVAQVILALRRECVNRGVSCRIRNAGDAVTRLLACVGIRDIEPGGGTGAG